MLQDELIQAADRERQLQMQLDKMKDDLTRLQTRLEQLSNVQRNFDDFKERSAPLWEHKMKRRDSRYTHYHYHHHEVDVRQKSIVTLQNKRKKKKNHEAITKKHTRTCIHILGFLPFSFISFWVTVDADADMTTHSQR